MAKQDFKLEVLGMQEVKKLLDSIPKDITAKIQADLNMKAAKIAQDELKRSAPEADNNKKSKNKLENNIVAKSDKVGNALVGFTKRAWYVKLIEYGTSIRTVLGKKKSSTGKPDFRKGKNTGKISPAPFVKAAHERAAREIMDFLSKNYIKVIHASIKKQNRKVQSALKKR